MKRGERVGGRAVIFLGESLRDERWPGQHATRDTKTSQHIPTLHRASRPPQHALTDASSDVHGAQNSERFFARNPTQRASHVFSA